MEDFLHRMRNDHHNFDKGILSDHVGSDPFAFFRNWYKEAFDSAQDEPHAMSISTVNVENKPSSRVVYLKELNDEGFVFYTNYSSQKGHELLSNPNICGLFFWNVLERQIRIEGQAFQVDSATSDAYFASRPRESQLGAWASHQSELLEKRDILQDRMEAMSEKFPGDVPRPPHWGGYVIIPQKLEFWQGRPSRLHDRITFEKNADNWAVYRKNP